MTSPQPSRPSYWPTLAFLVGYVLLLLAIFKYYLLPALDAFRDADQPHKELLSAHSALILAILLLILAAGIMLTFRIGRFFFPRISEKRSQTKYVDAWAEAGKRTPPEEQ